MQLPMQAGCSCESLRSRLCTQPCIKPLLRYNICPVTGAAVVPESSPSSQASTGQQLQVSNYGSAATGQQLRVSSLPVQKLAGEHMGDDCVPAQQHPSSAQPADSAAQVLSRTCLACCRCRMELQSGRLGMLPLTPEAALEAVLNVIK